MQSEQARTSGQPAEDEMQISLHETGFAATMLRCNNAIFIAIRRPAPAQSSAIPPDEVDAQTARHPACPVCVHRLTRPSLN